MISDCIQSHSIYRTYKQIKDEIVIAKDETAKCKATKEVIKLLTAQVVTLIQKLNTD